MASILGGVEEVRGVHGCIYEYISRRGWRFWSWRGFEDMRVQRINRGSILSTADGEVAKR